MRSKSRRREVEAAAVRELPLVGHGPEERPSHPAPLHAQVPSHDRAPLPVDPAALPAPGPGYDAVLARALEELDLDLTPGMRGAIEAQARLLLAWIPVVNLTGIREAEAIALEHVADSLAAVPALLDRLASRRPPLRPVGLLDLGSGAGYPGLPVAVAVPVATAVLVDSVGRKTAFLEAAAASAVASFEACGEEPPRIRAVTARAEELARTPGYRDRWEVVTARAVSPLPRLLELALPFVRPGGVLVAWKRDAGDGAFVAEMQAALPFLDALGADEEPVVERVGVTGIEDHRLVFVTKGRPTPDRWPRRAGGGRPLLP